MVVFRTTLFGLLVAAALPAAQPAAAARLPGEQLAQHLVSVATREWRDWGETVVDVRDGTIRIERQGARETDTGAPFDARERVRRYWVEGVLQPRDVESDGEEGLHPGATPPWSAAFVSYLMHEVGLSAPSFVADAAHSAYLRTLKQRTHSDDAQFELLLADEEPLRVGDLVCAPRNVSRDVERLTLLRMHTLEDLEALTAAHCDLVVGVDRHRREARAIGGNVADSVAMTRLPLTADGRAIRTLSRPWFVVARPR